MNTQPFRQVLIRRSFLGPAARAPAPWRTMSSDKPPASSIDSSAGSPPSSAQTGVSQGAEGTGLVIDKEGKLQTSLEAEMGGGSGGGRTGRGKAKDTVRLNALRARMEKIARDTVERRRMMADDRARLSQLGSTNTNPTANLSSVHRLAPPSPSSLTLSTLISATAHLGHNTSLTSPHALPYIYGTRAGISIIDLRTTLTHLRRAANVVRETVENDGIVVFLKGVKGSERAIEAAAGRLGDNGYAVTGRWLPGTITNATKVLAGPRASLIAENAEDFAGGATKDPDALKFTPSLIVVLQPHGSKAAMREAGLRNIPTIGITDTDVDPRIVTYCIPGNDDAIGMVELVAGVLGRAGEEGRRRRKLLEEASIKFVPRQASLRQPSQ